MRPIASNAYFLQAARPGLIPNKTFMDNSIKNVSLAQLKSVIPEDLYISVDDDFFIAGIKIDPSIQTKDIHALGYPCRFDGYFAIYCIEGSVEVSLNLESYVLGENTVMFSIPGSIVRFSKHGQEPIYLVLFAASKNFMSGIHVDFYKLFDESMKILSYPYFTLDEECRAVCQKYVALAADVLAMDIPVKKESIASLISSMFYIVSYRWTNTIENSRIQSNTNSPRVKIIFQQFITLVKEHHCRERSMAFYADKLCLTPKYLSKLIKQASGRSAPEWIVDFVILEAKNLLKYSDCTIKEIVYKLNFPNQSVFYKFFKSHTGMTPSEYRRS